MIKHLGIIMDGNRRWAKERFLPSVMGHKAGAENIEKVVESAIEQGIEYITFWGLSTENLIKRSDTEVKDIIKIINGAKKYLKNLMKNGAKIELIGDINKLPNESQLVLNELVEETKENHKITVVLALVYGGKNEIIRGIKKFISEGGDIDNLDESSFTNYLDTGKYPPADVIVRTGGDIRHSGFLLYSSDYSEYYFTEKKWPEFNREELQNVCDRFSSSKRNFGK
ncbi:di-trans,poly-cis-decaprenylcistransferase [Candidatus Gracilibacteria bacterium 28_42_T64]|nr:di-trans,poly-cis-decaprenylcistransferase [Candidatus Gracilibacteria bacterium 28_42_T64]